MSQLRIASNPFFHCMLCGAVRDNRERLAPHQISPEVLAHVCRPRHITPQQMHGLREAWQAQRRNRITGPNGPIAAPMVVRPGVLMPVRRIKWK